MYEYAMFAQTCKKRCKTSKKNIKLEVIEEMMKKVKFLLALAMCFAMGVNVTACGVIEYSGTAVDSESSESSSESSIEIPEGEPTDNEEGPIATVATATEEVLAAFNAQGVQLYDLSNFQATGETATLETAYIFSVTETLEAAQASEYANWIADYYVSVDTAVEAGKIGLAGSYDQWDNGAWVAFYSPIDVEAGQQIGLLESTGGTPWTYVDIVEFVGTFRCGAFDLDGACAGVKLSVELRLTNPENAEDIVSICVTEYTFA